MKSVLIAVALLSSSVAVAAPPTVTPPTPIKEVPVDPAALIAAERLLTAMDYDRMMDRTVDAMVAQIGPSMKKSIEAEIGEPVDDELIRRLSVIQAKFLRASVVEDKNMRRVIAMLYARHFTAADLDRLTTLYSDPVMKKWSEVAPALMGEMMPLLVDLMNSHEDELKTQIKDAVMDYFAEQKAASES